MPSTEMIAAYADGQLEGDALREVEAAMAADPELEAQVAAHRALKAQLSAHFAPLMDRPVPDRFLELLKDEPARGNIVDFAPPRRKRAMAVSVIRATACEFKCALFKNETI